MRLYPVDDLIPEMNACDRLYGYFVDICDGGPIVAYVEIKEATDPDLIAEGITEYYVVHDKGLFKTILWDDEDLHDFIDSKQNKWDFYIV